MTAMAVAPEASSARRAANRLAAASVEIARRAEVDHRTRDARARRCRRPAALRRRAPRARRAAVRRPARSGAPACRAMPASCDRPSARHDGRRARARCPRARRRRGAGSPARPRSRRRRSTPGRRRVAPPSRIIATRSPRSASTCAAVVGLTWPERLALGAAIGRSTARSRACAMGWRGHAHRDGVEAGGGQIGDRAIRLPAPSPASAPRARTRPPAAGRGRRDAPSLAAASTSGTCTISGLKRGRPLAAKMAATARPLVASAPRPYTVSVGKATSLPPRKASAAASIASRCWLRSLPSLPIRCLARQPYPSRAASLRPNLP